MSYDKLNSFRIDGENEYDDLCLKYGKARVDREIELELESKETPKGIQRKPQESIV